MTKSLTEKWKDGELEEGFYYILFASRFDKDYIAIDMFIQDEKDFMYSCCEDVKEVLAPVPSYDEFVQQREFVKDHQNVLIENMNLKLKVDKLEKKLAIATKALKGVCVWANTGNGGEKAVKKVCEKALKEIKGVK